ncbi:hypothetical protein SADUNF_Sadunf13G0030400 [Salix dunnii]|uniref:Protein kinase domain-containing protein n=1 Tax=Salix dunnii TaxID=1413687 RepID=A0A835MQW0_9ROSI|nr:hypothetical protein SADUNF_Sadunf13G0030400 [Salix dunnii]
MTRIFAELAYTTRVNEECDIWSFGVVTMEYFLLIELTNQPAYIVERRDRPTISCLLANPQPRPLCDKYVASELIARWPPLPKSFSATTMEDLMPPTMVTG